MLRLEQLTPRAKKVFSGILQLEYSFTKSPHFYTASMIHSAQNGTMEGWQNSISRKTALDCWLDHMAEERPDLVEAADNLESKFMGLQASCDADPSANKDLDDL